MYYGLPSGKSHFIVSVYSKLDLVQSGRFGKLNKRVSFPETLNLRPYMSELEDGNDDVYKLYAVIVHVDMLNASFFGHYICYVKDFRGNWYRVDDCKVTFVLYLRCKYIILAYQTFHIAHCYRKLISCFFLYSLYLRLQSMKMANVK